MPRIGHGQRLASVWYPVARQDIDALGCSKRGWIEAELPSERLVQSNEARRHDGRGRQPSEEAVRQTGVAVVECEQIRIGLLHHDSSGEGHAPQLIPLCIASDYL